jgi:hypothetical protein
MNRKIVGGQNNEGSVYPVAIFFIVVCVAGFLLLIAGSILEPFFTFIRDGPMKTFLVGLFPGGIALFILVVTMAALWMRYQKEKGGYSV